MVENTTELVFVTPGGSCYHTDQECPALRGVETVEQREKTAVAEWEVCRTCASDYQAPRSHELQRRLLKLDPDEVG